MSDKEEIVFEAEFDENDYTPYTEVINAGVNAYLFADQLTESNALEIEYKEGIKEKSIKLINYALDYGISLYEGD